MRDIFRLKLRPLLFLRCHTAHITGLDREEGQQWGGKLQLWSKFWIPSICYCLKKKYQGWVRGNHPSLRKIGRVILIGGSQRARAGTPNRWERWDDHLSAEEGEGRREGRGVVPCCWMTDGVTGLTSVRQGHTFGGGRVITLLTSILEDCLSWTFMAGSSEM